MQAVIRACGFPLAAPSANLSNQLSPTSAAHVAAGLGDRIRLIVDGGDCNVGIESTVVDVTGAAPRVLRPGIIGADEIESVAGVRLLERSSPVGSVFRSPGLLARHYCPKARLIVRSWGDDAELDQLVANESISPEGLWILAHRSLPMSGRYPNAIMIPSEPEAYARAMYGELHRCDEAGARCILVEAVPEGAAWAGIADRLSRAAAVGSVSGGKA
jgi:L-threonylcarbamoyladenylate synthase